ncbi:MAG: hypothetical protein DMG86_05215 [Acidobacteria bacterium]|nr:MAG: hypothetical protein DMG86_05215 [Acidobacteriota bacterium]
MVLGIRELEPVFGRRLLFKDRHSNNSSNFIREVVVTDLRPRFFDGQDSKFRCKVHTSNLDSSPSNLYYENDDVGFLRLLPVLYLLLYACVHWRREAADLRIF